MIDDAPSRGGQLLSEGRPSWLIGRNEDLVVAWRVAEASQTRLAFEVGADGEIQKILKLVFHFGDRILIALQRSVGESLEALEVRAPSAK